MNFTNTTVKDFIDYIITFDNIDEILEKCDLQSEKGFIFERLFDIVIKFGFCDIFNNENYNHLTGNSNKAKLKILTTFNKYLNEKVISGNSSGCSDITLQNKNDDTYIFISSKYPKTTEDKQNSKSVDYYDIQKIIAMIDYNKDIYKNYKIYLVVPNRKKLLNKVLKSDDTSEYITKYITNDNILDKDDLNRYFLLFKNDIIKNKNEEWSEIYLLKKENLILRFHQELITNKTNELIKEGNKIFGWFCKCRSGKTFMTGGIIIKQLNVKNKLNVLIITPAPTETTPQFIDDLFNKFKDFNIFKIHNIKGSKNLDNIEISNNNIFVISKQLLQKYINNDTILKIKNLKLDIIVFDEVHFSGCTDLSKDILISYSSKNTVKIYLTATYNKPLKEWNIEKECQMYWDIEDEQICKSILVDESNLERLQNKHGYEFINNTIKYYNDMGLSVKEIFKSYKKMPDLHIITNMFDSQRYEILKERLNNENKVGFCFDTLFSLNSHKTMFKFENEVNIFLRYISSSQKETDGDKTIYYRINNICIEKETRLPFTQIWFLPSNNINEISKCLKLLMKDNMVLKNYKIMCINRKNKEMAKDIKDEITKQELIAKSKEKFGLIILAGNMLNLGITLGLCDLVILLNNTLSSDKVLQQMYRCMTEGKNKKIGFVVDLNISRVLNTCINYSIHKNEKNVDDKMKYLVTNRLINIDVDMLLNKKIDSDAIIKKLMDIWKNDPINSFRTLLRNLDNDYIEFDNTTQKLINKTFTKSIKDNKINVKLKLKDEEDELQILPNGIEKEKIENNEELTSNEIEEIKEKKEIEISFTKDVLPFVIPLTCILTIKDKNMDFVKMLNDIKENPELLDTFNDQCLIWWNKSDLIDLIKDIVYKYFDKNSNTYNISIQFKMSMHSLIDNPKELLELINECLKPKEIEKKQFGEVFTPMALVNEMLDKLPLEVWKDKNLKWLDPCCGMGNFTIAIYLRLMESLKDKIIDNEERKKHILENMLYMCELNKKNVLICNQIFDIEGKYKLNIYEGDSLELNYEEYFKIKEFNIVVGNPPYNKNSTGTGNSIWQFFVKKALEILKNKGFLLFIHPCTYRKPSSSKSKMKEYFKLMCHDNKLLYLEIHNSKDGMKTFNCATRYDFYVLQKEKNINSLTIIKDEKGIISQINLLFYEWLPNYYFDKFSKLFHNGKEPVCELLFDCNIYETRRSWVKKNQTNEYKYKLINAITKKEIKYYYTNDNSKGMFGISKIIFGTAGINEPLNDENGEFGMTEHTMAIKYSSKHEAAKIIKCLKSKEFLDLIQACNWSSFLLDWRLFTFFKKNFYEEFC
jgi:adenine-specific DNA-methyltransferase